MRANGWRGATRARRTARTTELDPPATRAPGHGPRRWRAAAPSLLVVADFTYAPMVARFGYTAFAVDADAALIAGWEVLALPKNPASSSPLRHAAAFRARQRQPFQGAIHHSDAGANTPQSITAIR